MLPKIIHYCWFGNKPLPNSAKKCIKSWQKYLPSYEIKEWNENNFDVNIIPYTKEAYQAKKYAFVSDYVRFWVLYRYGGIYFDIDVEVIRSFDDIVSRGPFMGCENAISGKFTVAPGLGLGALPNMEFYKEMLSFYENRHFYGKNGQLDLTTIVEYTTQALANGGLKETAEIQCVKGIFIYAKDFFNPIDLSTFDLTITENTHSIHHYAGSWLSPYKRFKKKITSLMPRRILCIFLNKNK